MTVEELEAFIHYGSTKGLSKQDVLQQMSAYNRIKRSKPDEATEILDDISKRRRLWKDGYDPDPTFKLWGAGKLSHPKLWKEIIDDLISKGVEVKYGDKNLTYGPNPSGGKPGIISLKNNASITALIHEARHFYDDLAKGFLGFRIMEDPKLVWKMEFDAYMEEINFLKKNGEYGVAKELLDNAKKEKDIIEEKYNITL